MTTLTMSTLQIGIFHSGKCVKEHSKHIFHTVTYDNPGILDPEVRYSNSTLSAKPQYSASQICLFLVMSTRRTKTHYTGTKGWPILVFHCFHPLSPPHSITSLSQIPLSNLSYSYLQPYLRCISCPQSAKPKSHSQILPHYSIHFHTIPDHFFH